MAGCERQDQEPARRVQSCHKPLSWMPRCSEPVPQERMAADRRMLGLECLAEELFSGSSCGAGCTGLLRQTSTSPCDQQLPAIEATQPFTTSTSTARSSCRTCTKPLPHCDPNLDLGRPRAKKQRTHQNCITDLIHTRGRPGTRRHCCCTTFSRPAITRSVCDV